MSINEFEIEFDTQPNEFEIELNNIQQVYPELEDLEVTPTTEEQIFKSEKYGYNEVKVKGAGGTIPKVEGNILILSSGNVKGGVLSI